MSITQASTDFPPDAEFGPQPDNRTQLTLGKQLDVDIQGIKGWYEIDNGPEVMVNTGTKNLVCVYKHTVQTKEDVICLAMKDMMARQLLNQLVNLTISLRRLKCQLKNLQSTVRNEIDGLTNE